MGGGFAASSKFGVQNSKFGNSGMKRAGNGNANFEP
jgi:hypothetical protein